MQLEGMAAEFEVEFGPAGLADALYELARPLLGPDGKLPPARVSEFFDAAIPLAGYPRCTAAAAEGKCNKPAGHQHRCRTAYANAGLLVGQIQDAHDRIRAGQAGGAPPPPPPPAPGGAPQAAVLADILRALQALEGRMGALEAGSGTQMAGHDRPDSGAHDNTRRAAGEEMARMLGTGLAAGLSLLPPCQTGGPHSGPATMHARAAAGAASTLVLGGRHAVAVPYHPILPEHFAEQERWGAFRREAPVHLVADPFTGLTSLRIAPPAAGNAGATAGGTGRAPKSRGALARALPSFPAYCLADQQVEAALRAAGCTVEGYGMFRQAMLRLAKRADLTAPAEWQEFLTLDRNLRFIQHNERLAWHTAGGQIDANEVTIFLSAVAAGGGDGRAKRLRHGGRTQRRGGRERRL